MAEFEKIVWRDARGEALTCREKLKVLTENLTELQTMAQDVLEEAVLLKASEDQIREVLRTMVEDLENPYEASRD